MTISPPLFPDDDDFNDLANRLASELSSAFGYPLSEAEKHIRDFYVDYQRSIPEQRESIRKRGFSGAPMTVEEVFGHEDSWLVLEIGYRLAGGDPRGAKFLEWRNGCWDALKSGQRVPAPSV